MSQSPSSLREDYEAIEAAVLETPRGRWFLSEYLRRNQARETRSLLAAIRKLERAIAAPAGARAAPPRPDLSAVFDEAARRLAELEAAEAPSSLPEALSDMAAGAAADAARLEKLAAAAPECESLARRQHLMARKLETLAAIIDDLADHSGEPEREPDLKEDNLDWFADDDELFAPAAPASEEPPATPEISALAPASEEPEKKTPASEEPEEKTPANAQAALCETPPKPEADALWPAEGEVLPPQAPGEPACEPGDAGAEKENGGFMSIIIKPSSPSAPEEKTDEEKAPSASRPRIIITHKPSSREMRIPLLDDAEKTPQDA